MVPCFRLAGEVVMLCVGLMCGLDTLYSFPSFPFVFYMYDFLFSVVFYLSLSYHLGLGLSIASALE